MAFFSDHVIVKFAPPSNLLIFSEHQQEIVQSEAAKTVFHYLSGSSHEKYSEQHPLHIYQVEQTLAELQHKGYLVTTKSKHKDSTIEQGEGYSSLLHLPLSKQWQQELSHYSNQSQLHIVICQDLLDPRLEQIAQTYANQDWVAVKPFGQYPSISPIFGQGKGCYPCFHQQLLNNQPVRHWWYQHSHESFLIPCAQSEITSLTRILSLLGNNHHHLSITDIHHNLISSHQVPLNPACPKHGNPDWFRNRHAQAIDLSDIEKNNYRDGGFRTVEPEQTLAALLPMVDFITGHVTHLHARQDTNNLQGRSLNQIYFSSFYTLPRNKQSLHPEDFIYTTMGKGISATQSKISALSEAVERIASQYQGDEPVVFARASELSGNCLLPGQLIPLSEQQYSSFQELSPMMIENRIHQCLPYQDQSIHWTSGWNLITQQNVFLPLNCCYANSPYQDNFTSFFHNGGSAGNCIEEAILQGIFEHIERDAVAQWWYNKLLYPQVDYRSVDTDLLYQIEAQLLPEYDLWVLDVTSADIGVPVMAAIARHRVNGSFIMGYGCHLDEIIACQRALTELFQLLEVRYDNTSPFDYSDMKDEDYLFGQSDNPSVLISSAAPTKTLKEDILLCCQKLQHLGLDVIVIDNTRPTLPLNSVKVFIPGLCHIFPLFGLERLYTAPVKNGLLDQANSESTLNSIELLI